MVCAGMGGDREGQGGDQADEEIVDLGGAHGKVWRYSQGVEDGSLGQTPKSPHASFVAGETGALNDAGMGAPTTSTFYGQVDFRSVTMATQTDLGIRICAASADQRHGYVVIADDGAGFDLKFWDPVLGDYDLIDTNLSYTDWHTLGIEIFFNDGVANDVVNVYANGSAVYTNGVSWESYYTDHAESVDRLSFDIYEDVTQLGNGLYFDNILIAETNPGVVIPLPAAAWMGFVLLGGMGLLRRRRKA